MCIRDRPCSVCLLPRRRPGLLLRALRIAARGTSGRRRGAASKANALSPLITVVVSVCHSYRLVSCITCLSYKKDVQQMGPRVKSSANGTKGAKHTASKTSLYASDERTPVGRATTMSGKPCRSSQNGAARFAVLPSVELRAALLRQGRILKPWNKSARQNGPRKG